MHPANIVRLTEQLRAELAPPESDEDREHDPPAAREPTSRSTFTVPAARYRDASVLEQERPLFAAPRIVAASSAIEPGSFVPVDLPGFAALLTRTADGTLRAFANACRHRGTRLVDKPCAKAVVCPYHAWTYDLSGALIHVPHEGAFPGVNLAGRGLHALPVVERHGLVWMGQTQIAQLVSQRVPFGRASTATSFDLDQHLGPIDDDLAALDLASHIVWNRSRVTRACNWKLVMEAFLDGYHIRTLHRDSVYRYFLDAASTGEPVGRHIRAVTGRRALREAPPNLASATTSATTSAKATSAASATTSQLSADALRLLVSPSLYLFPGTIVVEHPDFTSIMTVHPLAPDLVDWDHMMFVPRARAAETEHWNKSWELIEGGVFQREDLWICEQAQRSIMAGTVDEMLFSTLEFPARWFHDTVDREIARAQR